MVLDEGRNREVRRLLARVGHKVQQLKRIAVGPVRLGDLPAGAVRPLTKKEVESLQAAVARGPSDKAEHDAKPGSKSPRPAPSKSKKPSTRGKDSPGLRTIIG